MRHDPALEFVGRTSEARAAAYATVVLLLVAFAPFLALVVVESVQLRVSPLQAIFGPGPGNPLIFWLYAFGPATLLQGAISLALRQHAPGLRIAGMMGALAVAAFCLAFIGSTLGGVVEWVTTGTVPFGDVLDLLGGALIGVPVAFIILALNARAAVCAFRHLKRA